MADKTNVVIGGRYDGYVVKTMNAGNGQKKEVAFLSNGNSKIPLSSDRVQSIEVVNGNAGNEVAKGAFYGGLTGAVIGSSLYDMLIKIHWKGGGESLLKVASGMYEIILASSYHTEVTQGTIRQAEATNEVLKYVMYFIIAMIWILFCVIKMIDSAF